MARILVADDDDGVRTLYALWLAEGGHQVTEACDGVEASHLLADDSFDLAVIDLIMPRADGISVIKGLRGRRSAARIIAMSAGHAALPAGVGLPLSAMFGADEVLYKPFNRSDLLDIVSRLLG